MPTGRYAPSPTGSLHVGNLRTAVLAWLFARSDGSAFRLRIEDLDPVAATEKFVTEHLRDLRSLGLTWDGEVTRQSQRTALYDDALATLAASDLLYPCYCTRREVRAAAQAPHEDLPDNAYPGTCRHLSTRARAEREAAGRRPSLRVRAGGAEVSVTDRLAGTVTSSLDDFVVRRGDGVAAYQLAVVVDDDAAGVGEVVRGDDLLGSTPRQVWLARSLGLAVPSYVHVPLVLGPDGERLAKRHGAVSWGELLARGWQPERLLTVMARSLGLVGSQKSEQGEVVSSLDELLARFEPSRLPRQPWVFDAERGEGSAQPTYAVEP